MTPIQKPTRFGAKGGALMVSAAAIAVAVPMISKWEGRSLVPYQDIVKVWTVCDGQTKVAMRRYTPAECDAMLTKAIKGEYGQGTLACAPTLYEKPIAHGMVISAAYNFGVPAFCNSTSAKLFNARDWRGGCTALLRYDGVTVSRPMAKRECRRMKSGRYFCKVRGLVLRRADEVSTCLKGL